MITSCSVIFSNHCSCSGSPMLQLHPSHFIVISWLMIKVGIAGIATTHCLDCPNSQLVDPKTISSTRLWHRLLSSLRLHGCTVHNRIMAAGHFSSQLFMDVVQDAAQKLLTISTWCAATQGCSATVLSHLVFP